MIGPVLPTEEERRRSYFLASERFDRRLFENEQKSLWRDFSPLDSRDYFKTQDNFP
ncbi:hypothetical protein SAMN04244579_03301 [Azotobacter beijerinckii]|uniref:Uncharacterized protein n=1 Tax=Azotobacter beijerinckii TaxID=170623 RepID=A0A1H6WLV9_9GAMM|nr:hypothetical protein SAMN04244579_03301 [Azotobacter beijerinckii]